MAMLVSGIGALLGGGGAAAAGTAAAGAATAGAAAATTAAATTATAATATAGLGTGLSAGTILKGVAGFASAVAGLMGADAQAEQFEMKAEESEMQAHDEQAKGLQRTTGIKRQLMKALGENAVKFAASGQLVGEGVSEDNALTLEERSVQDITVDRADTDARMAMHRARAAGWRRVAGRTRSAGSMGALAGFVGSFG
ncbi:hypothetical protein [Cohaesibacter celericrescens]|uniref:Uncharacterized protein n=1 Tax=Cohaesibacter celericrescens TaxID=2067669 RepID=A0A2N5XTP4_9HYPH|nr:hypothetical protein [Cohaesibacter celericrescens]PLW77896.1 hypothetical protein C0081_07150 [Cohaesibacter celericrescens]